MPRYKVSLNSTNEREPQTVEVAASTYDTSETLYTGSLVFFNDDGDIVAEINKSTWRMITLLEEVNHDH